MNKELKLLLYTTKGKMKLRKSIKDKDYYLDNGSKFNIIPKKDYALNGKIVGECDFDVEKIRKGWGCLNGTKYFRNSVEHYYPDYELEQQSCLGFNEIDKYLKGTLNENCGYAIHIKNLYIFDEPKELSNYFTKRPYNDINKIFTDEYMKVGEWYRPITKAPQNMMYAYDNNGNKYILISVRPNWMCKILNKDKTLELRRVVLKEMLG